MVHRQKLSVRIAAAAWLAFALWWLEEERTPQALANLGLALLVLASSLRALIVVRDDVVYRRGLFGWKKSALHLEELSAVSLRRELQFRHMPLVLRLSAAEDTEISIECWAWGGWRELAHRAGHFARQLGARRDDVSERRVACNRPGCPWGRHAADVVAGRPSRATTR